MSEEALVRPADRALVLATACDLDEAEVLELRGLLQAGDERFFEELAARVRLNDVAPQLWRVLEDHALTGELPAVFGKEVRSRRREVEALNLRRLEEMKGLFAELAGRGVELIVLKGVYLAETLWRDHGYKKMNDVDVLIHARDLPAVLEVYRGRGYLPLVLFEGGDPDRVDPDKTHHLPSFVSEDLEFVIGTHWELVGRKTGVRLDYSRMWEESVDLPFQGVALRALSRLDNLVHLTVHFHHYKTGVKELSDVYHLARMGPEVDWDRFARRLIDAGAASRAYYCLSLAHALRALGPEDEVAPFLARLGGEADDLARAEVALRLSRPHLLTRSRSLYEAVIEKAFTRFYVETIFHRKLWRCLVFWYRLLLPPLWVLRRTNVEERVTPGNFPALWWRNLARTGRIMSHSMGRRPWLAALAASVVLSLRTLPHYWRPPERDLLGELVEAVGGDEARIARLMDFLE